MAPSKSSKSNFSEPSSSSRNKRKAEEASHETNLVKRRSGQGRITVNVDKCIETLLANSTKKRLSGWEIQDICAIAREVFLGQPNLLQLDAPVNILGDIHGQYDDLLDQFKELGKPPGQNFLFLGDYVDRGNKSIETMSLLLLYKIKYPENMFLLRGNHECAGINRVYGFFDECKRKYNIKTWRCFIDCFNVLPIAAVVERSVFCCHGGISQYLTNISQINAIQRPLDIPDQGLMADILWADPDHDHMGWRESDRCVSYTFGSDVLNDFLTKQDLTLVVRGHQVVQDGYEFFQKRQLVTIFSAPNYCGEFDNAGASLKLSKSLTGLFTIFPPKKAPVFKVQDEED